MAIAIVSGVLALMVFVSFYGSGDAKRALEIKRGWRVRVQKGVYRYEEFCSNEWIGIEIKTIPSEESYGIYGIRIQPEKEWQEYYPYWARNRRDVISARIKEALPNTRII